MASNLTLDTMFQVAGVYGGYVVTTQNRLENGDWSEASHVCSTHEHVHRLLDACLHAADEYTDADKARGIASATENLPPRE